MKRAVSWCRQTFQQFCAGWYCRKEKFVSICCTQCRPKQAWHIWEGTASPMFRRCCAVSSILRFGVPLRRTLQRLTEYFERMLRHYQAWNVLKRLLYTGSIQLACWHALHGFFFRCCLSWNGFMEPLPKVFRQSTHWGRSIPSFFRLVKPISKYFSSYLRFLAVEDITDDSGSCSVKQRRLINMNKKTDHFSSYWNCEIISQSNVSVRTD